MVRPRPGFTSLRGDRCGNLSGFGNRRNVSKRGGRSNSRIAAAVWLAAALCLFSCGCQSAHMVELLSEPRNPLSERLKLTARGGPRPSERTMLFLRRFDLVAKWDSSQEKSLPALTKLHEEHPTPESCFALAEVSYIAGKRTESADHGRALAYYWNSVVNVYTYLFDPRYDETRNPYDPRFRGACDLYNTALESCLRLTRKDGQFHPGQSLTFLVGDRKLDVSIESKGFKWRPEEFDKFEFVSDFRVKGLKNQYKTFGLGVPLIAVRKQGVDRPEIEQHYAHGLSFPVTAFLRLDSANDGRVIDQSHLHLELHDPLSSTDIEVAGVPVPLESDISTPLAYFLDNPEFEGLDNLGLFRVDVAERISGIYMVQPYQPGKIPVVMIHGLWSSPMTWMEAFNDLQSNPEIRDKYQFWFYLYPTGKPFWETSAQLREDLASIHHEFGPYEATPVLDKMVLVGHSMGGLIAKMQTVESGDRYWKTVSDEPFSVVKGDDEMRRHYEQIYFFHPSPSVARVVTIGSPHHGSEYANNSTRALTRMATFLPTKAYDFASNMLLQNKRIIKNPTPVLYMTGVDSLAPESPILNVLYESPATDGVKLHNIVGAVNDEPLAENTDGVVTYASAHVDGVASEVVVNAPHVDLHRHPRTVLELQRILKEHLAEFETAERGTILQVKAVAGGHSVEVPAAAEGDVHRVQQAAFESK